MRHSIFSFLLKIILSCFIAKISNHRQNICMNFGVQTYKKKNKKTNKDQPKNRLVGGVWVVIEREGGRQNNL